jgi:hypothetical protein
MLVNRYITRSFRKQFQITKFTHTVTPENRSYSLIHLNPTPPNLKRLMKYLNRVHLPDPLSFGGMLPHTN